MRNLTVFLFPGAWGNDAQERVFWWFEHQVAAIRTLRPDATFVPMTYHGGSLEETSVNAAHAMVRHANADADADAERVALCYSLGRQVLAGALEYGFCPRVDRVAYVAGVPSGGVPVAGTAGVARAAPWFFLRSLGGTVFPRDVDEVDAILCSGKDRALAEELARQLAPEPAHWNVWQTFVPGFRVRTAPITVPCHAVVATDDLICGGARYDGDNVQREVVVPGAHHAVIRKTGSEMEPVWNRQAAFLTGLREA